MAATKRRSTAKNKKNSLVNNINRRKTSGTSRSKSKSTVSREAYDRMQKGWPKPGGKEKRGKR